MVTGLALMLVASSQALASPDATGVATPAAGKKATQDFAISFTVKKKDGKPIKITKFNYGQDCHDPDVGPHCVGDDKNNENNVPMTCDEGPAKTYLNGYLPAMKVKQKAFGDKFGLDTDGDQTDAEAHVTINGEFKNHNQKVVGDLRVTGDFGPTVTNCDSTKLPWTAS
jgi:hypothetical protein